MKIHAALMTPLLDAPHAPLACLLALRVLTLMPFFSACASSGACWLGPAAPELEGLGASAMRSWLLLFGKRAWLKC